MDLSRKIDLAQWTNAYNRKPCKGQRVLICDADWRGLADYEYEAIYNGKDFIVRWRNGGITVLQGVTYWKARK